MVKSSIADETKFPIIKELTPCAFKVGEIAFSPERIPEGDYNGVIKELREKMKNYKIQLAYLPGTSDDLFFYLPPLELPSGFEATPFPINMWGDISYLSLGESLEGYNHLYEFSPAENIMEAGEKKKSKGSIM